MPVDQDIEAGQLYRETDTEKAFKIMDVSRSQEQAKVLYLDEIEGEQVVDTRGQSEFKPIDIIRQKLARGDLVRVGSDPYRDS